MTAYLFGDADKPSLESLSHHGVKGMKWGQRKTYTSKDIRDARSRVSSANIEMHLQKKAVKKSLKAGQVKTAAKQQAKLDELKASFLANPDRITAQRMTRGEKFATIIGSGLVVPAGGAVVGTAAVLANHAIVGHLAKKQQLAKRQTKK